MINANDSSGAVAAPYNYDLAQSQLKRQRDFAQELANTQMPSGQMVSGWYVPTSGTAAIAAGLQRMLGAYQMVQADKAAQDDVKNQQEQTTLLAQRLAALGKPDGTPASFEDKLPLYQQLAGAGPLGKAVAQHAMERDLAGPTFQKIGEGESIVAFDKGGKQIGTFSGPPKKSDVERKADLIQLSNPNLTRAQAVSLATGNVEYDNSSGRMVDKVTGGDWTPGAEQSSSQAAVPGYKQPLQGPLAASSAPNSVAAIKDHDRQIKEGEQVAKATDRATKASSALMSIDSAIDVGTKLQNHEGLNSAVGPQGVLLRNVPIVKTDAKDFVALVDQFKSKQFLSAVQEMRGLGALSDAEGAKVQNAAGNLTFDQSTDQFRNTLADILTHLKKFREVAAQESANANAQSQAVGGASVSVPQGRREKDQGFSW